MMGLHVRSYERTFACACVEKRKYPPLPHVLSFLISFSLFDKIPIMVNQQGALTYCTSKSIDLMFTGGLGVRLKAVFKLDAHRTICSAH